MFFMRYFIMICAIRHVRPNTTCKKFQLKDGTKLFKDFIREFEKTYKSQIEYETRFGYFKQNLRRVNAQNCRKNAVEFGITHFFDLSFREIKEQLSIGLRMEPRPMKFTKLYESLGNRGIVPDSWDWRQHNAVTKPRTQGPCGSCWAFVATGLLESRLAIKYGRLVALSIQQLLDCSGERNDCTGGVPDEVLNKAKFSGGMISEKAYPYEKKQEKCRAKLDDVVVRIESADVVFVPSEEHLKHLVYHHGPIVAGMKTGFGFVSYKKGIVRPDDINCRLRRLLTHVVLIVGYGYDSKDVPYWILKNSYGKKWGDGGYMKLIRGQRACNISDYLVDANVK